MNDPKIALQSLYTRYAQARKDNREAGFLAAAARWEHQKWALDDVAHALGFRLVKNPDDPTK